MGTGFDVSEGCAKRLDLDDSRLRRRWPPLRIEGFSGFGEVGHQHEDLALIAAVVGERQSLHLDAGLRDDRDHVEHLSRTVNERNSQ